MTAPTRDREFAAFVETDRALLQRCAYLLTGHRQAAEDLVDNTLAELYHRWNRTRTPRRDALTLLYRTDPDRVRLPWVPRARFELLEGAPRPDPVPPIVTDLLGLAPEQRLALICERVVQLPSVEIATVLGTGVDEVLRESQAARNALVGRRSERADDATLRAELGAAVPAELHVGHGHDDAAHGRLLRRRRGTRRALVLLAVLAVALVGLTQLRPAQAPTSTAPTSTAPTSTAPPPTVTISPTPTPLVRCGAADRACQAEVVRAWRAAMSEVVLSHLDPQGRYFNGSSYYARDQAPDLWRTGRGALALEFYRVGSGSTELYLQIATTRAEAPRCGTITHSTCSSVRFMDGNRFILSDHVDLARGLEVQYRPDGSDVITVVARPNAKGKAFGLERGDLITLIQDPRLRLPPL